MNTFKSYLCSIAILYDLFSFKYSFSSSLNKTPEVIPNNSKFFSCSFWSLLANSIFEVTISIFLLNWQSNIAKVETINDFPSPVFISPMEPLLFPLKTESANLKIANIWTGLGVKLFAFLIFIQITANLYERFSSSYPFLLFLKFIIVPLLIEFNILVINIAYFLFVSSYLIISSTVLSIFLFFFII